MRISYLLNYKTRFTLHARNIVTDEERDVTVYANDAMDAYAQGFRELERDLELGDRPWSIVSFTQEPA